MKGTIKWTSGDIVKYDISEVELDTNKKSVRDTLVDLLVSDWEFFGEDTDCIIISLEK